VQEACGSALTLVAPSSVCRAVDEGQREQGIAHLVEHVTFLGSKKREGLLGTGAR
jgi:secreted Zn-dependent insulinase-like peptidase